MTKLSFILFIVLALGSMLGGCKTHSSFRQPSSDPAMDRNMKMSAADTAPVCTSFSDTISPEQIAVIVPLISTREHRVKHALWHATRAGLSTKEESSVVEAFGQSWGTVSSPSPTQFHPMCPGPSNDPTASDYNPAGEDFLYMHRTMVNMVRQALIDAKLPCIAGWTHVPTLADWPIPDSDVTGAKSPSTLQQLQAWDQTFQDPKWLGQISLSQLGWALEFTIHNNLHIRYATTQPPAGFAGVDKTGGAPIPFNGKFSPNWQYDKPAYNWLADPYGAAVNPTFWKIHGYVDQMIDQWLKVHNFDRVAADCTGATDRCYQWRGMWTGDLPANFSMAENDEDGSKMTLTRPTKLDPATISFNQKRMQNQQIGVLNDEPGTPGNLKAAAPPLDPIQFTQSKLCAPASK